MGNKERKENKSNPKGKKWIGISLAIIFLVIGFYTYYIYFYSNESMAIINPEFGEEFNILIVGYDDSKKETRGKKEADAIIVLTLKSNERKIILRSVPSNSILKNEPLKNYDIKNILIDINELVGFKPSYYFTINYDGFKKIVNELSGIEVQLDKSMEIPDLGLYFKQGNNLLSGKEALNYARWYKNENDSYNRIYRQYDIIQGVLNKITQTNTLLDMPKMYSTLVNTIEAVETNLDKELVASIFKFLRNRENVKIEHKIIKK